MSIETEKLFEVTGRMPESVHEQIANLPVFQEREQISKAIFEGIAILLATQDIHFDKTDSTYGTKSLSRIYNKIGRRNTEDPQGDIYRCRFELEIGNRGFVKDLIQAAYPLTPKVFPWGKPTARDYRDPAVLASHIEKSNPHMSPLYSALHINFVFRRKGSRILDIGEVQIMTKKEYEIYKQTRDGYSNGYSPASRDQTLANS
jgi:hypothetical protein